MRPCTSIRQWPRVLLAAAVLACLASAPAGAQEERLPFAPGERLPFAPGERLTYLVQFARFGGVGHSTMWIEAPTAVRGSDTWRLRFDFKARVGPVKAVDRTSSWFDARRVTSLRFLKHERHPLSRHDEEVELFPDTKRWESKDGSGGDSPTNLPLDELSFMYFLRTLPLDTESSWKFWRHYDAERNPTIVRVLKREVTESPAGRFRTVQLEMRVKNPRVYKNGGEGVIRVSLTDDACRIPVRIESTMPMVGTAVMLLETHNVPGCTAAPGSAAVAAAAAAGR